MADQAEKAEKPPKKDAPKKEQEKKSDPPPLLQARQVIAAQSGNQYLVDDMLGKGGFGEVYKVTLIKDRDKKFAMKVEPNSMGKKGPENMLRLKVEIHVFDTIAASTNVDKTHFVKVYDKGITATFKYYVMDIIWSSLKDVIVDVLGGVVSPATKINIARQTLKSIDALHELGFLHRDIKAANYAVGLPPNEGVIYMLDFGISRPYRNKDGTVKIARATVKFMGTLKYASIRSLQDEEQCRKDDLEVWLYMMLQIYDKKNLTWSHSSRKKTIVSLKIELMEKSRELDAAGKLNFPKQYHDIISKIYKMEYVEAGDFKFFNAKLDEIVKEQKINEKEPLDWIKKCVIEEQKKKEKAKEEEKKKAEGEKKDEKKEEKKDCSEKKGDEKDDKKKAPRKKGTKKMDDDEIMRAMDEMLLNLMKEKRKLQRLKGELPEDEENSRSDEDDEDDNSGTDDDSRRRPRRGRRRSRKRRSRERKRRARDYSPRDDLDDTDERDDRDDDRTPERRRRRRRSPPRGEKKTRVSKVSRKQPSDREVDKARIPEEKRDDKKGEVKDKIEKSPEKTPEKIPEKTPEKPPEKESKDKDQKTPEKIPEKTPEKTPEKESKDKDQKPPEKTPEKTPEKESKDKDQKSPEKTPEKTPEIESKDKVEKRAKRIAIKQKKRDCAGRTKSDSDSIVGADGLVDSWKLARRKRRNRAKWLKGEPERRRRREEKEKREREAKEKAEREKAEAYAKTPLGKLHGLLTRKEKKVPAKTTNEPAKKADEAAPAKKEPADAKKK